MYAVHLRASNSTIRRAVVGVVALLSTATIMACGATSKNDAATSGNGSSLSGTVYVLLPNTTTRWEKWDAPDLIKSFAKLAPGMKVNVLNANASVQQQEQQMDTAIANGAKAILLAAQDTQSSGGMLRQAAQAGIPVISYGNDPGPGPVAYNVEFPLDQLGSTQAQYLLQHFPASPRPFKLAMILGDPGWGIYKAEINAFNKYIGPLIQNGTINVVCNANTPNWVPATAETTMEQCLTKTNDKVDGIFGMNDETLTGMWAAVTAQGLQNKIKVLGGIDGTLPDLQRVLTGWQLEDQIPDYARTAQAAAELTIAAIQKMSPPAGLINDHFDNNYTRGGVPTDLVPSVLVTPKNFQQAVINSGIWTKAELCTQMPATTSFCG